MSLTLATRASPLALWQARAARARLLEAGAEAVELLEVRSSGDRDQATALARFGRIGIFTVEVDTAVVEGRADVGVHSLKDMTTTLLEGVALAAVLTRGPVQDVLVGPRAAGAVRLAELPRGARVATGSLRRRAMAGAARGDLAFVELRGNVDTRLAKLDAGEAEALVLARAGLERLGLGARIHEVLDTTRFLPAVGQGIVGLTCRAEDAATRARLEALCDAPTWAAALAERALLRELRGGCNVPLGGHATVAGDELRLRARVLSIDGRECVAGERRGPAGEAEALGRELAAELLARGAARLIEGARG